MFRKLGPVLVTGAAVAALAGCANAHAPTHASSSYTVPGPVHTLIVTAHVGYVKVTGGGSGAASVTEHVAYHGTAPATTHRLASGTLSLDSHCPSREVCSVSYDITVPRATAVHVTDDVGDVSLSSLSGPATVTVDTGKIDLSALAGPLTVTNHAGSVDGQHISSTDGTVRVSAGAIDLTFSAPPAAIKATTDVGAITLRVPGGVAYDVHANATVGNVQVKVTQNTAAPRTITLGTRLGSITVEPSP